MERLVRIDSQLPHVCQGERLPFAMGAGYQTYVQRWIGGRVVYMYDDDMVMASRDFHHRGFRFLQFLSEPRMQSGEALSAEAERTFFDKVVRHSRLNGHWARIVAPPPHLLFQTAPADAHVAPFGSYRLDLREDVDTLFKGLHSKHRNVIRKVQDRVEVKVGLEQFPHFYRLYAQTMARSGLAYESEAQLTDFANLLGPSRLHCAVVYYNGGALGALMGPKNSDGFHYLWGGSQLPTPLNGAVNYLHWHSIQQLKAEGVERYDFVGARLGDISGTKYEGIQRFKSRFGGQLVRGCLWKMDLQPWKANLYNGMMQLSHFVRRRQPLTDLVDQLSD